MTNQVGERKGKVPIPSLDESLAQLEQALDLFSSEQVTPDPLEGKDAVGVSPIQKIQLQEAARKPETAVTNSEKELFTNAINELKKSASTSSNEIIPQWSGADVAFVAEDESDAAIRRFPLLTDGQKKLMLIGVLVMLVFAAIGYLLWQQQKKDEARAKAPTSEEIYLSSTSQTQAEVPPADPAPTEPLPENTASAADQSLSNNVRQILTAYNPSAIDSQYKVTVKDGIITLNGEAQTQLEKDGAENVLRPLNGIKKIINNLNVRGLMARTPGSVIAPGGVNGPVMYPITNPAEAKRLEEALKKDLAEGASNAEKLTARLNESNNQLKLQPPPTPVPVETVKVDDSEARKKSAAQFNEELAQQRRIAEEKLKEREEAEKADTARKAREQAAPPVVAELRSGTVTWVGTVKGVEDIVIRGASASVNHVSGDVASGVRATFSAPIPNAPISVRVVAASGKAPARIIQQPSAANNFTTIVRVGSDGKGDSKPQSFSLRWSNQ